MKTIIFLLVSLLTTVVARSEPVIKTPEGQQFLDLVSAAIADQSNTGVPELNARSLAAQTRLEAMGPRANEMVAEIFLETIDLQSPGGFDRSSLPLNLSPERLLGLASFDPAPTKKLLGPLMDWLHNAATGRIPNLSMSGFFVLRMTKYVERWGGPQETAKLKELMEQMEQSPNAQINSAGRHVQNALEGNAARTLPYQFQSTLYDWCKTCVAQSKGQAVIRTQNPFSPGTGSASTSPSDHPEAPGAHGHSLLWLLAATGAAGASIWLVLRRLRRQR